MIRVACAASSACRLTRVRKASGLARSRLPKERCQPVDTIRAWVVPVSRSAIGMKVVTKGPPVTEP